MLTAWHIELHRSEQLGRAAFAFLHVTDLGINFAFDVAKFISFGCVISILGLVECRWIELLGVIIE
jgi:hypothetical protein